jgi:hypothetical protein
MDGGLVGTLVWETSPAGLEPTGNAPTQGGVRHTEAT